MNNSPNNITILYVDDEQINLELFKVVFKSAFEVLVANSALLGLEILDTNPEIKVVISDMRMPGMNGIEFIKKAKLSYTNIVYYILTGYEISDEIKEAIETNLINKYFKKPFNKLELLNELKIVTERIN
jgi:response regulator RpfG family c-di-GMP phosphodiesterase